MFRTPYEPAWEALAALGEGRQHDLAADIEQVVRLARETSQALAARRIPQGILLEKR